MAKVSRARQDWMVNALQELIQQGNNRVAHDSANPAAGDQAPDPYIINILDFDIDDVDTEAPDTEGLPASEDRDDE
jgi:hypothetical protein